MLADPLSSLPLFPEVFLPFPMLKNLFLPLPLFPDGLLEDMGLIFPGPDWISLTDLLPIGPFSFIPRIAEVPSPMLLNLLAPLPDVPPLGLTSFIGFFIGTFLTVAGPILPPVL